MKDKYDVVIIGAGIGGLVCGCYLAKAGLKVLIVEKNDKPGGYCTSFEKDGYRFDVGVHYLGGIKRGILGQILEELDIKDQIKFHQFDPTDKIIMPDNITYIRANPYDTIKEFKKSFPKEKRNIEKFFKFVMQKDFLEIYRKTRKVTFKYVLDNFFDREEIKDMFSLLSFSNLGLLASKISALTVFVLIRQHVLDPGYTPIGGVQIFPERLAELFKEKGGEIIFSKEVTKIFTKGKKAEGIIINKEDRIRSKWVVSNIDATHTFKKLLRIKPLKEKFLVDKLAISPSSFVLYLGIDPNWKYRKEIRCARWILSQGSPFLLKKEDITKKKGINHMIIYFQNIQKSIPEKEEKCIVEVTIGVEPTSEKFWKKYKEIFFQKSLSELEKILPSIRKYIKLKISATPYTFYKYTLNKNGAMFGWASTPTQISSVVFPYYSSVSHLLLTGHWTTIGTGQGGIPTVALSGRGTARIIIQKNNKEWRYERISTYL